MRKIALSALLACYPALANAESVTSCFPENNLHLEDDINRKDANMTEQEFNDIITKVADSYTPFIQAHGATLNMERKWTDSTVNAYASQSGSTWTVSMFGGLARRPETTDDGFALVVCHELGHHLAGFPLKGSRWASSEGQSDYFATQTCAKRIWADDLAENAAFRNTVDADAKVKCDAVYTDVDEQNLCYRTAMGGKSLATLLGALGGAQPPEFSTPDTSVVNSTYDAHPQSQCRLDTYMNGALCTVAFDENIIPGKNHPDGQGSLAAEQVAAMNSCTEAGLFSTGLRPKCWYAPKLQLSADVANASRVEVTGNGDAIWDPGEVFAVNLPLTNNLLAPITNASLTIKQPLTGFEVTSVYPEIDVAESMGAENAAEIDSTGKTCGETIALEATVNAGSFAKTQDLSFQIGGFSTVETVNEANANAKIPDNDSTGMSVVLAANSGETVGQVSVTVDVTHTYVGDLEMFLVSPAGNTYKFYDRVGGSNDDVKATFDVEVNSEVASGDWTLKIADRAGQDTGKLNAWGLDFSGYSCTN